MASRSHVDVNERRLRPIYDCLDNGNNKKAIQEADKVLKKQKDLTCAKVLKALALLRMGRQAEGTAILAAIHESEPTEEQTLNAMSICYKEAQQYNKIASLYEAASKHQPNNEDILSCLFMAHVRLGNYQQQQRTAMLLHKLRPNKNPYYFWAVMSIVMQAHKNEEQKKPIFLTLAEKMTRKYIEEDKIEAEAEILLYLIILELQEKWEEALKVLEGPLGEQLGNELNLRETRLANVCTKLGIWDKVNSIYKKLLNHTPDDWLFWLTYLDSGFHLADGSAPSQDGDKSAVTPDCTLESMLAYIKEKISEMQDGVLLRGPYLAEIEFLKRLLQRKSDFAATVGSALNLLQEYYNRFGQKACCYTDMKLYVDLLNPEEAEQFVQYMKTNAGLDSSADDTLNLAADINQLTKHLVYIQLTRYMGRHIKLETEEALSLSQELLIRYRDGLKFGENLLSTDLQYSDNYLLLAVHLLLDVWTKTGDDIHLWRAIVHLELGIKKSTSNYQMKLLLIRLYCIKGVFGPCPALYDGMEIKHIMNDTMGHIVSNHVIRLGHFMEAGTMYATMVRFFVVNQKEASEHLMSSYKFGSFGRIQEFVEFQERLDNALQYHSANTEKMLLELIMQTDRHDSTELAVDCMNVHPLTDSSINISKLRDNRDLTIALCWDPPNLLNSEENKVRSIQEEELWLSLRWTLLHILLLSVMVGKEITGASVVNGSGINSDESLENKKERTLAITVLNQRMLELEVLAKNSDGFLEPRQYHTVQGPFRTRISEFLREPHIGALSSMVQCINYIHKLTASGLESSNPNDEKCWTKVQEFSSKLVVKDIGGLVKDHQGKRQLDSSALEQIVASVETISYLTILAGVCNRGLKCLKIGLTKKSKKGKGPSAPLPETFENFNNLIKELSATTKELHQIASGLDPVFSSLDIASLRLADIPEEEELQREAERLVWNKVERSVQQSSREICEVLHHKQFYLNTLMV